MDAWASTTTATAPSLRVPMAPKDRVEKHEPESHQGVLMWALSLKALWAFSALKVRDARTLAKFATNCWTMSQQQYVVSTHALGVGTDEPHEAPSMSGSSPTVQESHLCTKDAYALLTAMVCLELL